MTWRGRSYSLSVTDVQELLWGWPPVGVRYFLIMDFEATCDKEQWFDHEIIEFPAVLLDASNLEKVDEFREFVRPTEKPQLTAFCKGLTSIRQIDVDNAQPLKVVLHRFRFWLDGHGLNATTVLPVTYGDWDLKTMLPNECLRKELSYPDALQRWCNIKVLYSEARNLQHTRQWLKIDMAEMLQILRLKLVGNHHLGIDDARNIAKIFQVLLVDPFRYGWTLPMDPYGEVS